MPLFRRPIPPPLDSHVDFQVLDLKETVIQHGDDSTMGHSPGDWSWLEDPTEVKLHLASYATRSIPQKHQRVGIVLYGNTKQGHSVTCWVKFHRTFRVEVHESVDVAELVESVRASMYDKSPIEYVVEKKPRRYGWKSRASDPRLPKLYTLIRVTALTLKRYTNLIWGFKNIDRDTDVTLEIHEEVSTVSTELQAIVESGIRYGSWIRIPVTHRKTRHMTSDYELVLSSFKHVVVDQDRMEISPFRWGCVDLECYSPTGRFPSPEEESCPIIMAGIAHRLTDGTTERILFRLTRGDEKPTKRMVAPLKKEDHLDDYTEYLFAKESDLITAIRSFIVVMDMRMVVTFNGDRFDWKYIMRRVRLLGMDEQLFTTMGQYLLEPWREIKTGYGMDAVYLDAVAASEGKQNAVPFDVPGRVGCDLRFLYQKTMNGVPRYRFKRYALDPVAEELLGTNGKLDMPASEMFRIWREGTPDELRRFCDYCIVDVQLLVALIDKEDSISQIVAMADTSHTCLHDIINVGQFRKVENATVVNAAKIGAFTNNKFRGIPDIDMKGAMVVEPVRGPHGAPSEHEDEVTDRYIDTDSLPDKVRELVKRVLPQEKMRIYKSKTYVAVLDFASLYPSIMMSYIMCIFTIILPGKEGDSRVERAYKEPRVPETGLVIHEEIIYEDDDPKKAILRRNRFVQNAKAPFTNGILPKWEADLKQMRKRYKKLMVEVPLMRGVYDARQLATKISMNSVYGVLKLFCVYIAESVTSRGRRMLCALIDRAVELGLEVIYGDTDSIMIKKRFESLKEAWDYFTELEGRLNTELYSREGDVNALEFEKIYRWYLLMGKKAYIGLKKEKLKEPYKLSSTGTCDVRRDRPAVLTDLTALMGQIMSTCSEMAIESTGLVVMEALREHFEKMVQGKHPVDKYAVTTTIQTINPNTENRAHMVLARRLEARDGVSFTVGDSIDVVQVKGHKNIPDSEKVAAPADLKRDPEGMKKVDHHLYFKKKVVEQTRKMAKWYIPEKTLNLMIAEYEGVLKPETKSGTVKSKSVYTMFGGNEEERRKRLFSKSYSREIDRTRSKRRRIEDG